MVTTSARLPKRSPTTSERSPRAPLDPETGECLEAYFSARNAGLSELLQTEQFLTIDPNGWPDWVQRIRTMP